MADMAMDFASILSAEYADKMMAAKTPRRDRLGEPIGTGPFQFVPIRRDAVIRYARLDQHWGGWPKIDNLVYAITTGRVGALRQAEDRRMPRHGVQAGRCRADEERPEHQPDFAAGLNVGYIAFNVEKKPF